MSDVKLLFKVSGQKVHFNYLTFLNVIIQGRNRGWQHPWSSSLQQA